MEKRGNVWLAGLGMVLMVTGAREVSEYWTSIEYWRLMVEFGYKTPLEDGIAGVVIGSTLMAWMIKKNRRGGRTFACTSRRIFARSRKGLQLTMRGKEVENKGRT